tara:strand:+ start:273 stop:1112 length:840 start_codon:yes stop_codon:yes gene_type:complete
MPDHYRVVNEASSLAGDEQVYSSCRPKRLDRLCNKPLVVMTTYAVTGSLLGCIVSLTVNNAMFEVSAVPYFAIVIGLVLMMLGGTMAQRAVQEDHEQLWTRTIKGGWAAIVLLAGLSCFALERRWEVAGNMRGSTVPMYMLLGAALSFTVSISLVDLIHMCSGVWEKMAPSLAPPMMDSPQQMIAGFVGAVTMGASFGLVFAHHDVVDARNQMERLRQEQRASLPVGILFGAGIGAAIAFLGGEGNATGSEANANRPREYFWTRIATRQVPLPAEGAGL